MTADRAQSEVVGYVLIFSVVVLMVALVTVSGQAGLGNLRDGQRTANVEASFAVLAENVDDVVRDGAPSRSTELDLSGGRLSLGERATVRVVAANSSTGTELFNRTRSYRPIVYRSPERAELAYANGAVIARGETGGVALLRAPRMLLSADRSILPVVDTRRNQRQLRGGSGSIGGDARVLVRAEHRRTRVLNATDAAEGPVDLSVTVNSSRTPAWAAYFEGEGFSCPSPDPPEVTCTRDDATDRATLVAVEVAVSFE